MLEKFIKLWYKYCYFVVKWWYSFTMNFTFVKMGAGAVAPITIFSNEKEIPVALKWGTAYKKDPLKGFFDYMTHPTAVQYRINKDEKIGDCDDHAAYWAAALITSGLSLKTFLGTVQFKDHLGNISGHAICVFVDNDGISKWCDYGIPRAFKDSGTFGWVDETCFQFGATPIAAGLIEVIGMTEDYTLKLGNTYTKIYNGEEK